MNTFQQEMHRVSLACAKLNFLKSKKIKVSVEAMNNVDTKLKEFQKLFRKTKKAIIEANIEPKYLPLSDVNILSKQKSGFILEDSNTFVHLQGRNYKVKQKVSV